MRCVVRNDFDNVVIFNVDDLNRPLAIKSFWPLLPITNEDSWLPANIDADEIPVTTAVVGDGM